MTVSDLLKYSRTTSTEREEMIFGERLDKLRQERRLSMQRLANELGLALSTVKSLIEKDVNPSYYTLIQTAKVFGVSTDWLLGLTENRNINMMKCKWKTVSVDEDDRPWLWACENCGEETDHKWDFCPVCGCEMTNPWKPKKK